jgi:hypothetical protein
VRGHGRGLPRRWWSSSSSAGTVHSKLHMGVVTGATRTYTATSKCSALKTTPSVVEVMIGLGGKKRSGE